MEAKEIREVFLNFFRERGHRVVPSSSLVPKDDPTLLFTNAGMVQFKKVFLGQVSLPYKRATSVQKCMRAGGKHNDLENVGKTARHHTFFEMLGNFSFGDYFKKEAIEFAWDFLTNYLKLSEEKLFVTIFENDDEAAFIWREVVGLPEDRIIKMGEKDNFWSMGDIGPCGPCSEIIFDQGKDVGCGRPNCFVGCDCDRFLEIWNLVFMQYEKKDDGRLLPLPKPSIDTGMGLERIAAVVQGKRSNYETDLFSQIIGSIEEIAKKPYRENTVSMRVIADHARAITFLISDGVLPSNEGRGYVLRRVIRRAERYGLYLGIDEPFLYKLKDSVILSMSDFYPEIKESKELIEKIVRDEEERFRYTLKSGLLILEEEISNLKSKGEKEIPADFVFKLYDTYGLPLDFTLEVASENSFSVNIEAFNRLMERQRERARIFKKAEKKIDFSKDIKETIFVGYDELSCDSQIISIFKNGDRVSHIDSGEFDLVLDKTPFYGESGGQVGDMGNILSDHAKVLVVDTKKIGKVFVHRCKIEQGILKEGDFVRCYVLEERRKNLSRHHSATHILHAVLREKFGKEVRQAGSLVAPSRLRFDFSCFSQITEEELKEIEFEVNRIILQNIPVRTLEMRFEDAISFGALAFFEEKYEDVVRVVEIGDISKELCGGTHVKYTGEIGLFKIEGIENIGAGVKRIEARVGFSVLDLLWDLEGELKSFESLLNVPKKEIMKKIQNILSENSRMKREVERLYNRIIDLEVKKALDATRDVSGIKALGYLFYGFSNQMLRLCGDRLKDRLKSCVLLLFGKEDDRINAVCMVTKDLTDRFSAKRIIAEVMKEVGGKGGGRDDMAQGAGKKSEGVSFAIQKFYKVLENG